jgi:hypothetical protein
LHHARPLHTYLRARERREDSGVSEKKCTGEKGELVTFILSRRKGERGREGEERNMQLLQDHLPDSFSPATFFFYLLLASATRTFCVELSAILMEVNMM